MRAAYHYQVQAGYSGLFHAVEPPPLYDLPSPVPGHGATGGPTPLDRRRRSSAGWFPVWTSGGKRFAFDRWERYEWQSGSKAAKFEAVTVAALAKWRHT